MNDKLIDQLSKLKLEETSIKRNLDRYYRDENTRTRLFYRLKEIQKEIKVVEFKLRIEKEMNR